MSDIQGLVDKYKGIPDERFFCDVFGGEYKDVLTVPANVVLDIGATAGEFSAYIYDKADVIYAIEPYKTYYNELVSNIQEFGLDKIKPFNIALSDRNGRGLMTEDTRGGNQLTEGDSIEVMTLAKFIKNNNIDHIDVLKIDIEGADRAVFESKDFIEVADKISYIIGEHIGDMKEFFQILGFKQKIDNNNTIYYK